MTAARRSWDALVASASMQMRIQAKHPMTWVGGILNPLLFLALLVLPRGGSLTGTETTEVLTGVVLAALWASSLWGAMGVLRRERAEGTLAATLTGVQSALLVMLGKMLGAILLQLGVIAVTVTAAALLLGAVPVVSDPAAFALGLLAVVLGGGAASLLVGSALVVSRHGFQLTSAVGPPVLLLGGMLVPLSVLPPWLSWVGLAVNLRWLREFLISAATGTTRWPDLAAGMALTMIYAAVGLLLFHHMLRRARQEATLELA